MNTSTMDLSKTDFKKFTPEKLIERWRQLDDELTALKATHETEEQKITDNMDLIIKVLTVFMKETGQKNVPTDFGTAYRNPWFKATVSDPTAWWSFVLEQSNPQMFLTNHVSKDQIKNYMDTHEGRPPPGISTDKGSTVTIRRK